MFPADRNGRTAEEIPSSPPPTVGYVLKRERSYDEEKTVTFTNRASGATPLVLLASYDANGQYQGLMYVTVREPVGGTVDVTLPVDNSGGKIAQLKVFAVKSFADMTPIGNVVSFPA